MNQFARMVIFCTLGAIVLMLFVHIVITLVHR